MPGRTPREAFDRFIDPLQRTVSCISRRPLIVSPRGRGGGRRKADGRVHSLSIPDGPVELGGDLTLEISMLYEIVASDDPQRGPFKVSTRAYSYTFSQDRRIAAAHHWHPFGLSTFREPHIHVPDSLPGHYPSGRVSLEEVVRFCIRELGVEPLRDDWESVLAMNEDRFQTYRTWPPQPQLFASPS